MSVYNRKYTILKKKDIPGIKKKNPVGSSMTMMAGGLLSSMGLMAGGLFVASIAAASGGLALGIIVPVGMMLKPSNKRKVVPFQSESSEN